MYDVLGTQWNLDASLVEGPGPVGQLQSEIFKGPTSGRNTNVTWDGALALTYRHVLQGAKH